MVTSSTPRHVAHALRWRVPRLLLLVVVAGAVAGCPSVAPPLVETPEYEPTGQRKCSVAASSNEPLIVEWPAAQRAKLEALATHGTVVVRYQGCEMTLLGQCRVARSYGYTPTTQHRERVTIRNADELYASLPLGAASLEAELGKSGELVVDMTIVGRYEAGAGRLTVADLEGDCSGATHVVRALTVGAFEFYAAGQAKVGGRAALQGAGAGARSEASKTLLRQGGKPDACEGAASGDDAPPFDCGALLRLEVEPIGPAEQPPLEPVATATEPGPAPVATTTEPGPAPVATTTEVGPAPVATATEPREPPIAASATPSTGAAAGSTPFEPSEPTETPEGLMEEESSGWEIVGYVAGGLLVAGLVVGAVIGAVAGSDDEDQYVPEAGGLGEVTVGFRWPVFSW